ncbi:AAEL017306-PA [Aedes aegypti]|uniref:AAEL017306-PA n=1 Tax=Aedes aegypti TaxID=7159 RepID=J9HG49_AEDAE|nr:AAEL017306-PA [Aedes aegypti]
MDPSESHCMLCDRPNHVDNLVQCDRCDGYLHYSCAEVGDSIADPDRSFTCNRCIESDEVVTVSSHSSHRTSNSSRSAARAALRLQQLEKERQIRRRELEDAEKFQRMRRHEQQLQEENEDGSTSTSRVSSRRIRDNTRKWVRAASQTGGVKCPIATTSTQIGSTIPTGTSQNPAIAPEGSTEATLAVPFSSGITSRVPAPVMAMRVIGNSGEQHSNHPTEVRTTTTTNSDQGMITRAEIVPPANLQIDQQLPGRMQQIAGAARTTTDCNMSSGTGGERVGAPISVGLSTDQVRTSISTLHVRLQPIDEAAQTSTPKQAPVVQTSVGNQSGPREKPNYLAKSGNTIGAVQGQLPLSTLLNILPGEPPPGPKGIGLLPPFKSTLLTNPNPSISQQPNSQTIGRKTSVVSSLLERGQCGQSNPSLVLPVSGHQQFSVSNPQESQPPLGREQCMVFSERNQSVIQPPPGYEKFVRNSETAPAGSWNTSYPTLANPGSANFFRTSGSYQQTRRLPDHALNSTEYPPAFGHQQCQLPSSTILGAQPGCQAFPAPEPDQSGPQTGRTHHIDRLESALR